MPLYTDDKNAQIVLALLKEYGVRTMVISPGTTNMAITWSVQNDPYFHLLSAYDERSAAYMACGLAAQTGEPVAVSCTGATASRDYLPGLTEAYYRKLPVLALTSMHDPRDIGNLKSQVLDRADKPRDTFRYATRLDIVKDGADYRYACLEANRALSELTRDGGGPVAIELICSNPSFTTAELPDVARVQRHEPEDEPSWPELPRDAKVAVFLGASRSLAPREREALERFAATRNAVVLTDVSSGYRGEYALTSALACIQLENNPQAHDLAPDLIIHLGEVTGDYDTVSFLDRIPCETWRVSPDGEFRQSFRRLTRVFSCRPDTLFAHYAGEREIDSPYRRAWFDYDARIRQSIPALPFSNPLIAQRLAQAVPAGSVFHPAILNSLVSVNMFPPAATVSTACNAGGFGIDGCLSTLLGASLAEPDALCFCLIGDLAFFYDMNALGNRHVARNLRVIVVNNDLGMTFKQSNHFARTLGGDANAFIAASGHNLPHAPVPETSPASGLSPAAAWASSLGFTYLRATSAEELDESLPTLTAPSDRPILLECVTREECEREARDALCSLDTRKTLLGEAKGLAKDVLPKPLIDGARRILGR